MEYKFITLDKCGEEAEWLCYFLEDISRWPKYVSQIYIHCIANLLLVEHNNMDNESRHIHRRHSTIKQLLSIEII